MKNDTYTNMKAARDALVLAGMSLFYDKLAGKDTASLEERIMALVKEYDKIINDYVNSDINKDNN